MKQMTSFDVTQAVSNIANYYRSCRLYTALFNADDVYDRYVEEFTEDTRLIVEQGYSYKLKDEYLIALDLERFANEHPAEYKHYFDCISSFLVPYIEKEREPVLFICAAGPSNGFFTRDTYKLFKEWVYVYGKSYTIITDCPVEIDIERFADHTGSRKVLIAGREYYRWARRC